MSWKSASITAVDPGSPTASAAWSITRQLTLFYTLSAVGLLTLATLILYQVLAKDLKSQDNKFLAEKIHDLRTILREHANDPKFLEQEVKWEGLTSQAAQYYTHYSRVLDATGRIEIETPGMTVILRGASFPLPMRIAQTSPKGVSWNSPNGRSYRLVAAWADAGGSSIRLIQLVLDNSKERRLLARYRQMLAIVLLLGILFSALIGWVVARNGLYPLRNMAGTVQRITVNQLHERLDPARWPKELTVLANAFNEMLARLEDSFARLSQFSADLAHELRTPISNLVGETEVTLARVREPKEYQQVLESSLEEYGRLSRMIDNLLFLARTEGAQILLQRVQFSGRAELETIREFYDAMAEEQGVSLRCQGEASLEADRILLRRAVSNLVSNALRYTRCGGEITLSVTQCDEQWAEISVSDTGCGIEPEHLPKLFDRFYRVDSARVHDDEGTGLGLAIVKSIMELHKGAIDICSQPGQGTTVALRFPVSQPWSSYNK